jgi:(E)-4-hydroxy-3-methylbut-2-enyl-diphosphate synthase
VTYRPGESKQHLAARHREAPAAPVFVDGKKFRALRGATIATEFKALDDIDQRYGKGRKLPESTAAE